MSVIGLFHRVANLWTEIFPFTELPTISSVTICKNRLKTRKAQTGAHPWSNSSTFNGPLRFEVEGANAARAFAREQNLDDRRVQLIWDAVALNSTPSIALHKEVEVALSTMGIGLDWVVGVTRQ